jgi:phage gp46-like protein
MTSYQGDIKKYITASGSSIQVKDGEALRDRGVENAIMYSLFVRKWALNVFAQNPEQVLESRFEELHEESITVDNLLDIEDEAKRNLKWLVGKGIADKVEASTSVDANGIRHTVIDVHQPGGTVESLRLSKYASNWEAQVLNPANEQVVRNA